MTVRNSLLAILADRPAHGYSLKSSFEERTSGAWPLNVGQVYTTLNRLERDGLVAADGAARERARQSWKITREGRRALAAWYRSPVEDRPRDELAIKILLAVAADDVDVAKMLQSQRTATMKRLQDYTRQKRRADPKLDSAWLLLLDGLILKAEAEIKWLDLCEERLGHRRRKPS